MRSLVRCFVLLFLIGTAEAVTDEDRNAIRAAISGQIEAFRQDDAAAAFSYAAPAIRDKFTSEDLFLVMVRAGYAPLYRARDIAFGELREIPSGAIQSVYVTDAEGESWLALYTVEEQPDGTWKITGCVLARPPGESI